MSAKTPSMQNCQSARKLICALLSGLCLVFAAAERVPAEPMFAPTMEEALKSDWILEASYQDYFKAQTVPADRNDPSQMPLLKSFVKSESFDYFNPPVAQYKVISILKRPPESKVDSIVSAGKLIYLPYEFHDGSACIAPPEFKFSPGCMPPKGSRWILYLNKTDPHNGKNMFRSYRGDFGRCSDTAEKLKQVTAALAKDKH